MNFTPTASFNGYAVLSLASSFQIASLGCTLGFSGNCQQGANTNVINITGSFGSGSQILTVSGFSSPTTIPTDYSVFTTYDSSNYIIDQSIN